MDNVEIALIDSETNARTTIKINPETLSDVSAYFKAMLSGNFRETDQQEIAIYCDDFETSKYLLEYINSNQEEIDFDQVDLFRLLDLADYWLCYDYIADPCSHEIADHWHKYDLQKLFTYMEKYDFDQMSIDFDQCEIDPVELMTLAKSTPFLDMIEAGCLLELRDNPKFTIVDELNFYINNIIANPDLLKSQEKDSTYVTYGEEIINIFDRLEKEAQKYRQSYRDSLPYDENYYQKIHINTIQNELLLAPNLGKLNLKVLEYSRPSPDKEYENDPTYSWDEQDRDDLEHYKEVCTAIFSKILEIAENKSSTTQYLIEQIIKHNYYDLISQDLVLELFDAVNNKSCMAQYLIEQIVKHNYYGSTNQKLVAKLCEHISQEASAKFVKTFLMETNPDVLPLIHYVCPSPN